MKKLVMEGAKQSKLVEVEKPKLPANNPKAILVKLKYCGVCMSEHYAWSTAKGGESFGHEPVGVVEEIGSGVTRVKVGDRVGGAVGGGAEYQLTEEPYVFRIPDNTEDEEATFEPLACLVSAVSKVKIPVVGDKVAVVGCGYMGCGAISLLAKRGAYVVAVDIRRESLENAKKYGAREVYTPDELPKDYVTDNGDAAKTGFPLVMEWGETNESLDLAIHMTRQCGQLAIGAYHTGGKRLVDVQLLNVRAIDCLSTHPRENDFNLLCYANVARMFADNDWIYKHVPTKVYPITMFDKAHEELPDKFGKYLKAIVDWTKTEGEPYIID